MGQYYDIINFDKKIVLKLDEFQASKLSNYYGIQEYQDALIKMLSEEWKGDTVILLGDYADCAEAGTSIHSTIKKIRDKYCLSNSVQDWSDDLSESLGYHNSEGITMQGNAEGAYKFKYVYNHALKQYLVLSKFPLSENSTRVPFLLLIAVGNGYGGGDISDVEDLEMIGSWADTIESVTVEENELDVDYEEIIPRF